jgi:site-specific DNA recombinase
VPPKKLLKQLPLLALCYPLERTGIGFDAGFARASTNGQFCLERIATHQQAEEVYMGEGSRLLDLAHNAHRLFQRQSPKEQQRMLKLLLSNSTWKSSGLTTTWRQPFDLIENSVASAAEETEKNGSASALCTVWRPRQDSNLRPLVQETTICATQVIETISLSGT